MQIWSLRAWVGSRDLLLNLGYGTSSYLRNDWSQRLQILCACPSPPLKPSWRSGERCKLPQRDPGQRIGRWSICAPFQLKQIAFERGYSNFVYNAHWQYNWRKSNITALFMQSVTTEHTYKSNQLAIIEHFRAPQNWAFRFQKWLTAHQHNMAISAIMVDELNR